MTSPHFTISEDLLYGDLTPSTDDPGKSERKRRRYCWVDGEFFDRDAAHFSLQDYLSACHASVCMDVRACRTQARHFSYYYDAFAQQVEVMGLDYPPYATYEVMAKAISDLLKKERYFGSVLVRLVAYTQHRKDVFGIASTTTSLLMYADPSPTKVYTSIDRGLFIGIYKGGFRISCPHSHVRHLWDDLAWSARPYMERNGYANCVALNDRGSVAGLLWGTLYVVQGDWVYTPPLRDGGVCDPIRMLAPWVIEKTGKFRLEEKSLSMEEVLSAKEVFILSTAHGVEGVLGVEKMRYPCSYSKELVEHLNEVFFPDQN